jgi:hypothetical protein
MYMYLGTCRPTLFHSAKGLTHSACLLCFVRWRSPILGSSLSKARKQAIAIGSQIAKLACKFASSKAIELCSEKRISSGARAPSASQSRAIASSWNSYPTRPFFVAYLPHTTGNLSTCTNKYIAHRPSIDFRGSRSLRCFPWASIPFLP